MNFAPHCTKKIQIFGQRAFDLSKFRQREAIVLAHSRWPEAEGAMKIEYRLTVVPNSMHMGGDKVGVGSHPAGRTRNQRLGEIQTFGGTFGGMSAIHIGYLH